ncbi:hypothetical protein ONZ51_g61 [Trametes cubensis]|uniref:Chromo domain-containing protein n=1 Tax=Trametes cubensis TaxID=1111947 RepID=A0AAD7XGW8_9APHY|nr:hypothetical protein ONZ51_g61 [Trametes cubensis]
MANPTGYPPFDPAPFTELMGVFASALDKNEHHMALRLNKIEATLGGIAKTTAEALQIAHTTRQETKEGLDRLQAALLNTAKSSRANHEKVQTLLGAQDMEMQEEGTSLFARMQLLEQTIAELTESVSDPDAARPAIVRHEAAVNTSPELRPLSDAGVDTLDLELPSRSTDTEVQTNIRTFVESAVSPPPEVIQQTAVQFTSHQSLGATQSSAVPFIVQPLAPAEWATSGDCSDGTGSSGASKGVSPIPILRIVASGADEHLSLPPSSEGRASSAFEEQEILNSLRPDVDRSQTTSSSSLLSASQTPEMGSGARPSIPLPRRNTLVAHTPSTSVQTGAPSGTLAQASALGLITPTLTQGVSTSGQSSTSPPQPPKVSPPLPRRATLLASLQNSAGRVVGPSSLGRARLSSNTNPVAAAASSSSLSSISSQPKPIASQGLQSSERSDSLSSLSSLSSPPQSQSQPQAQTQSRTLERTRASERIRASSTASNPASARDVSRTRESAARGRSRSATRGGKASASARVGMKKERSESDVAGRAAKRRKTLGDTSDIAMGDDEGTSSSSISTRGGKMSARGGRGPGRGRGRGRGRGGSAGMSSSRGVTKGGDDDEGEDSGGSSDSRGKGAKYEPPRVGTDCPWPDKIDGDEAYQREFVQCDNCEAWYHFGCVGLHTGDPRLEPDAQFVCPPCESSEAIREQRQGLRFQEAACCRPDCDRPGLASETNEYFVERIIGRRPYDADLAAGVKRPTRFLWLVKWDGWKAEFASWTEREHLGDCARLIEEFEHAAEIEGRNLDKLNSVVVLNEGSAVGW